MPLLSIGEFARRTRLSPKALRIYDRIGLLSPAAVDPETGYRRYREDDVNTGRLIGLLRGADLTLAEIGSVLGDPALAVERLQELSFELERRQADRRLLMRHVQSVLTEGADPSSRSRPATSPPSVSRGFFKAQSHHQRGECGRW